MSQPGQLVSRRHLRRFPQPPDPSPPVADPAPASCSPFLGRLLV